MALWATSTCRATFYCNLNSLHLKATWQPLQAILCCLAQVVIFRKVYVYICAIDLSFLAS